MNALEAIERTEVEIRELDEKIRFLKKGLESENKLQHILEGKEITLFDYENHKKSLSIVLESAKLFHQHIVPTLRYGNKELGVGDPTSVFGIPVKDFGIEVDE